MQYTKLLLADRYHQKSNYLMTPAMLRARKPFFWKNMASFAVLAGVALGVYGYTFAFLTQDDFGDIPVPPIEAKELELLREEYNAHKHEQK